MTIPTYLLLSLLNAPSPSSKLASSTPPLSSGPPSSPSVPFASSSSPKPARPGCDRRASPLATAAQGALGCVMTVAIPYMINPGQANMQGKLGFFFGGLAALCLVWSYLRVPETSGRTYEELDILFDRKVGVRQFEGYGIDSEGVD